MTLYFVKVSITHECGLRLGTKVRDDGISEGCSDKYSPVALGASVG